LTTRESVEIPVLHCRWTPHVAGGGAPNASRQDTRRGGGPTFAAIPAIDTAILSTVEYIQYLAMALDNGWTFIYLTSIRSVKDQIYEQDVCQHRENIAK